MNYKDHLEKLENNAHFADRYKKFIDHRIGRSDPLDVVHHILPKGKGCWPEFSSLNRFPWNGLHLTHREHYIAHLLLMKTYPGNRSMLFAFNMMRSFEGRGSSKLFERSMRKVSKIISETNSGRKMSDSRRKEVSERFKGKVLVRDIDGEINYLVRKEDFDPTKHIFHRVGKKHYEQTKTKIGRRGKKWYHNPSDRSQTTVCYENQVPPCWVPGNPNSAEFLGRSFVGKTFYHDPVTGKSRRFFEGAEPEGWEKGRKHENNGFKIASSMIQITNLREKRTCKVFKENVDRGCHGPGYSGSKQKYVIVSEDHLFTTFDSFLKFCLTQNFEFCRSLSTSTFAKYVVPKPHFNNNEQTRLFREAYQGSKLEDFGFTMVKLEDFDTELLKERTIYWND